MFFIHSVCFPTQQKTRLTVITAKRVIFTVFKLELCFKLLNALRANSLTLEINYIFYIIAKNASGLIFLENDFIIIRKYFDCILLLNVKYLSDFDRKNYST